jgi:hypothetical protein
MTVRTTIERNGQVFESTAEIPEAYVQQMLIDYGNIIDEDEADDFVNDVVIDWSDSLTDAVYNFFIGRHV